MVNMVDWKFLIETNKRGQCDIGVLFSVRLLVSVRTKPDNTLDKARSPQIKLDHPGPS